MQTLCFPARAIPSSFPFLSEGFVLLYKEIFNCETQKPLPEKNTFFFSTEKALIMTSKTTK